PANNTLCASQVGRTAGPVDAASHARFANAATDPSDQCSAGALGRAWHYGCAGARGDQRTASAQAGTSIRRQALIPIVRNDPYWQPSFRPCRGGMSITPV